MLSIARSIRSSTIQHSEFRAFEHEFARREPLCRQDRSINQNKHGLNRIEKSEKKENTFAKKYGIFAGTHVARNRDESEREKRHEKFSQLCDLIHLRRMARDDLQFCSSSARRYCSAAKLQASPRDSPVGQVLSALAIGTRE